MFEVNVKKCDGGKERSGREGGDQLGFGALMCTVSSIVF